MQPTINGRVVERSYEDYRNNLYLVNRRYQRKLVWGLDEKQAFIDSISNGYPIPLFLFAKSNYKGIDCNEIIDGMQRLNAIFTFIENDYATVSGEYFDLTTTALTKNLVDQGILTQKLPVLNRDVCVKIVSYELPYSVYDETNPDVIDEVFRRINSNGKHLSRQEIRQAGVVTDFAQLVRNISTRIRGDVSHDDFLLLSQMQSISISKDCETSGINPDSVFWVKENIITKEDLRQSIDEEQIADLLGSMLLTPTPPSNVSVLDEYYGYPGGEETARSQKINEALNAVSSETLSRQFFCVYDEIRRIFHNRSQSIIGHMVGPRIYKGPRYFQILFLALYDLLVKKEKKIVDYEALYEALRDISKRTLKIASGGGWWTQQQKTDLIASTSAVLAQYCVDRGEGDPMLYSYANEIETLLKQSYTENAQYDFKQGIYNLQTGERNDKLLEKIFKTLTAMANSEKKATGYILIGVADNFDDAEKIREAYGTTSIPVGSFYVTGLNGETDIHYGGNYDAYLMDIRHALEIAPIDEHYKRQIGSKMRMVTYHDRAVVILKIINDNGPVAFGDAYYTRSGASNDPTPVSVTEMPNFFKRFA